VCCASFNGQCRCAPFSQYKGQVLIVCLHHLPSVIWSVGLAIQMTPQLLRLAPALHRATGYAMAASSISMAAGAAVMALTPGMAHVCRVGMNIALPASVETLPVQGSRNWSPGRVLDNLMA
jgi:hypothetical protein